MTNEQENVNMSNPETEEQAKPKKKKPIMIFRPQNSKTGAVKAGQRPGSTSKPSQKESSRTGTDASARRGAGSAQAGTAHPAGSRPAGAPPAGGPRPAGAPPVGGPRPAAAPPAGGPRPAGARPAGAPPAGGPKIPAGTPAAAASGAKMDAESAAAAAAKTAAAAETAAAAQAARSDAATASQTEGINAAAQTEQAAAAAAETGAASVSSVGSSAALASSQSAEGSAKAASETAASETAGTRSDSAASTADASGSKSTDTQTAAASGDTAGKAEKADEKTAGVSSSAPESAAEKATVSERRESGASEEKKSASADQNAEKKTASQADTSKDKAASSSSSSDGRRDSRSISSRDYESRYRSARTQTGNDDRRGTGKKNTYTGGSGSRPSRDGQGRDGGRDQNRSYNRDGSGSRDQGSRDGSRDSYRDGGRGRTGSGSSGAGSGRDSRGTGSAGRTGGYAGRDGQGAGRKGGARPAMDAKPFEKEGRSKNERGGKNDRRNDRADKGDKFDRMEHSHSQGGKKDGRSKNAGKFIKPVKPVQEEEKIKSITIPESITIKDLADLLKVAPAAIVKKLFMQGKMVTVNEEVDFETAEEIAIDYDVICEKEVKVDVLEELLKEEDDPDETKVSRPPVVCVMGHVDHGKTSLLDAIRNTHVTDREAGGITQHIGASVVTCNGQKITFLDTPGHEAFTAMRMRGANSTDIAILVVAADDGVMPQTVEAINHAKAAGIEIIVAINKIDKEGANIDRVKQELTEYELIPEDWGGSTVFVPVSAKTHEGIDTLLEMILLTSEVLELKANPNRRARGIVIEAELDKGRGPVATILVQKGTLHVGDAVAAGPCYGKVRAMVDDKGRSVKEAGPSTPVEILGLSDVPSAGEIMVSPETEKEARSFAETFISEGRERMLEDTRQKMSLDDLFSQIQAGNLKELNLIVKADVQGSVEAVKQSLLKLSNEEVVVKVIHSGAGAINESDVVLASASNAIIIGFNVRPDATAKSTAEQEGVDIRLYSVIYDAIADVEAAMKGMLDPIFEEKVIGHAEIRQIFRASGVGNIAGSYVLDGVFQRGCNARITREGRQIFDGAVASLKRFKDDVKEVRAGYECGLVFDKFNDIAELDQVEAYIMVEVPR